MAIHRLAGKQDALLASQFLHACPGVQRGMCLLAQRRGYTSSKKQGVLLSDRLVLNLVLCQCAQPAAAQHRRPHQTVCWSYFRPCSAGIA